MDRDEYIRAKHNAEVRSILMNKTVFVLKERGNKAPAYSCVDADDFAPGDYTIVQIYFPPNLRR